MVTAFESSAINIVTFDAVRTVIAIRFRIGRHPSHGGFIICSVVIYSQCFEESRLSCGIPRHVDYGFHGDSSPGS